MTSMFWDTIDYRDARYHGRVKEFKDLKVEKDGPGVLILDNNTIIIAKWKNNYPICSSTIILTDTFAVVHPIYEERGEEKNENEKVEFEEKIQEWMRKVNSIEVYSPNNGQYLLYGQCEKKFDNLWNWIVETPDHHLPANGQPGVRTFMETLTNRVNHPPQIKTLKYKEVKVKEYRSLNRYEEFIERVKQILQVQQQNPRKEENSKASSQKNREKQEHRTNNQKQGHFVIKETSTFAHKKDQRSCRKINTIITSSLNTTIRISITAIKRSKKQIAHDDNISQVWTQYCINNVEVINNSEKKVKYHYGITKTSEGIISKQVLMDGSEVVRRKSENLSAEDASRIKALKNREHIRSIRFSNLYHHNFYVVIDEILSFVEKFWGEYGKNRAMKDIEDLKEGKVGQKNSDKSGIKLGDNGEIFVATQEDVKEEIKRMKNAKRSPFKYSEIHGKILNRSPEKKGGPSTPGRELKSSRTKFHEQMTGFIVKTTQKINKNNNYEIKKFQDSTMNQKSFQSGKQKHKIFTKCENESQKMSGRFQKRRQELEANGKRDEKRNLKSNIKKKEGNYERLDRSLLHSPQSNRQYIQPNYYQNRCNQPQNFKNYSCNKKNVSNFQKEAQEEEENIDEEFQKNKQTMRKNKQSKKRNKKQDNLSQLLNEYEEITSSLEGKRKTTKIQKIKP